MSYNAQQTALFSPPSVGGLDLNSSNRGCARLGGEVDPPLGVVVEEVFDFRLVELAWDNASNRTGSSNHEKPHNSNAGQVRSDPVSASGLVVLAWDNANNHTGGSNHEAQIFDFSIFD